jgi:hypothetical protein
MEEVPEAKVCMRAEREREEGRGQGLEEATSNFNFG